MRVLVVNGKAVAAMERRSSDGSFKSNISLGGYAAPYAMSREMAELAVRTTRALDLDIAGIDILLDADGYRICEANSSPGSVRWSPPARSTCPRSSSPPYPKSCAGGREAWDAGFRGS